MSADKRTDDPVLESNAILLDLVGRQVVLDTCGPILYIGTLRAVATDGFSLENADMHDCRDGHASKEQYLMESRTAGIRANRQRVLVLREAVISVSALEDILVE